MVFFQPYGKSGFADWGRILVLQSLAGNLQLSDEEEQAFEKIIDQYREWGDEEADGS